MLLAVFPFTFISIKGLLKLGEAKPLQLQKIDSPFGVYKQRLSD